MAGMFRYHTDSVRDYDQTAEGRTDGDLMGVLRDYEEGGSWRHYLYGEDGEDHRAWRRAVVREALMRGLIDADPGDAP